ncbi:flavodoxin FldB [Idiomarina tyrosinivorans]|uniref:Flavodoxin n=1 Tax=Idiomarina tyrosinivorans TaxID=1445662 RepID=A0A432ZPA1_9GAMM|nr:flavodoxin FldB [Idiomarina tyrosinivorans]RUO79720.1 flavodoxin FldB [Idiomarina tyrosinivorans]
MSGTEDSGLKIGLFYGSTTCYTEIAAEKLQQAIGEDIVELFDIKDTPLSEAENFDILIFGISTWDFGELQEDWESHWDDITPLNLAGKIVALYGMGDQQGYTDWFQDALGMLHHAIADKDCQRIGFWPNGDDYDFAASKALTDDGEFFFGLALDEDSQYDLSDDRIAQWSTQILEEVAELLSA